MNLIKYFLQCFLINTPIIHKNIKTKRQRPISFFNQIHSTKNFINKLHSSNPKHLIQVDISNLFTKNTELYTFDAVHYTKQGHLKIYESLELKLC